MGSEAFYPEESPTRLVRVDPFWIDPYPVTNAQFAEFVSATEYRTFAEMPPDPKDYPGLDPRLVAPGSLVFRMPEGPVLLGDWTNWWEFCVGADWRHPSGPESSIEEIMDHPVVHVNYDDALAYANWKGRALPTEAEWEFAARGGRDDGQEYMWGDSLLPEGPNYANFWQGEFPYQRLQSERWTRTSPVGALLSNDFGLFDMIGNVWEWTSDWYGKPGTIEKRKQGTCCTVRNPRGGSKRKSFDPCLPHMKVPRRVTKGGSHLCAENYCQRYRPAARQGQAIDSPTSHIGFRCILRK